MTSQIAEPWGRPGDGAAAFGRDAAPRHIAVSQSGTPEGRGLDAAPAPPGQADAA